VEFDGVKIDFYDAKNKVVHEVKKSDKVENAHKAQVLYYLYKLLKNGVEGAMGIIEYPKLRQTETVEWTSDSLATILQWEKEITEIMARENCPATIKAKICKSCSYHDFCYVDEEP
jgi:CRISPR-associated exonuclease Cas4